MEIVVSSSLSFLQSLSNYTNAEISNFLVFKNNFNKVCIERFRHEMRIRAKKVKNANKESFILISCLVLIYDSSQIFQTYRTKFEEQNAMIKFLQNQRIINKHNLKFAAGEVNFTMGIWRNSDMTTNDINRKMHRVKMNFVMQRQSSIYSSNFRAPSSINWVTSGYVNAGE